MPSHPDGKPLVELVRQCRAVTKLQRLWRKTWSRRTTVRLLQRYHAQYARVHVANMLLDDATALFQKRDVAEVRRLLSDDAKAFLRKPDAFFWMKKILARIVEKMRLRHRRTHVVGTAQRDFQTNCNPIYFIVTMPLAAKQTSLGQDAMILLQSKELSVLHKRVWHTLEEVMAPLMHGRLDDQVLDRLYAQFCAFSDLYRFTVLYAEGVTASKLEAYILEHKNDLLLLESDPAFTSESANASIGTQLKKRIQNSIDVYVKRIKQQHNGDRRYRFFEQGELQAKTQGEEPNPLANADDDDEDAVPWQRQQELAPLQFFLAPMSDRTAMYELVHQHGRDASFATKHVQQPIFRSPRVRLLYERDLYTRLRAEHILGATMHRPVALEVILYMETALQRLLPRVPMLLEDIQSVLDERRALALRKGFVPDTNTEPMFDRKEADEAFQFLFGLFRQMRQRIYVHAHTTLAKQITQQRLDQEQRDWDACFQQKTVPCLSYVAQTQKLMDMLNTHLVPRIAALCVKVEMAPFGTCIVEYERARVSASIQTQTTMTWLTPYIKKRLPQLTTTTTVSEAMMHDILVEAVWGLVTSQAIRYDEELEKHKKSILSGTFVWPETLHFEKQNVFGLMDDMALFTQHMVAFRTLSTYWGQQKALPGLANAKDKPLVPRALEARLKEYGVEDAHADYLVPLIQAQQHRRHAAYKQVQEDMLQSLKQTVVGVSFGTPSETPLLWRQCGGEKGIQILDDFVSLIHINYAIFSERYHLIAQTVVEDAQMTMIMFE